MRVIDVHVHTFPEKIAASALEKLQAKSHTRPFTNGTISALCDSMREAGVTESILQPVATRADQVTRINDNAIRLNVPGVYSFGAMHPYYENYYDELARIRNAGLKGIKLHPVYQGVNANDKRYVKILARSCELGLAVLIHAGWDIGFPGNDYAMPGKIFEAVRSSGASRIILAHMGGWKAWDEACGLFAEVQGVCIDTAFSLGYMNPEKFTEIIKIFGAERVLFGSDSPWASQVDSIKSINELELSEREKELIFYGNAEKLLAPM